MSYITEETKLKQELADEIKKISSPHLLKTILLFIQELNKNIRNQVEQGYDDGYADGKDFCNDYYELEYDDEDD